MPSIIDQQITELEVAEGVFTLRVNGLRTFANVPFISAAAATSVNNLLATHEDRLNRIRTALQDLQDLKTNGYPNDINLTVVADVITELKGDRDAIDAALAQFSALTEATGGALRFTDK